MMERIILSNVSKKFKIGAKREKTALKRLSSIFSIRENKNFLEVLNDISIKVEEGEIVGIIGRNGSGKTTLLRIISGIIEKDSGIIETNGKIISLINLFIGLNERLTMKENIYLCCSFFGFRQNEIKKRLKSIIHFAELGDFVNTKLYKFSEGMKQRIVFSMALHSNPKIFLLDDIFVVGDEQFRRKCLNKISELVKNGSTILLVSHDLWMIDYFCHKVIWIDKGKIMLQGPSSKVIKAYLKFGSKTDDGSMDYWKDLTKWFGKNR